MRKIIGFIIASFLVSGIANAATTNLGSCEQSTVNNAISAASPGDTLVCPAGSWSWSNVDITKNVTLQGAGIGQTIITITGDGGLQSSASHSNAFRVTGFTFTSNSNIGNYSQALIQIYNNHDFRIDNNRILVYSTSTSGTGGQGIGVWRDSAGLIDHNTFDQAGGSGTIGAYVLWSNSGTTSSAINDQKYSWLNFNSNAVLGSADHTLFVEDNYFNSPKPSPAHNAQAMFGRHGGVVVFRHNELHNVSFDNHGFCNEHGGFAFDINNNQFIYDLSSGNIYGAIHIRGGTGVIYNNSVSGSFSHGMWWEDYRTGTGSGCSGSNITFNIPGYGNVTGSSSCISSEGHPCAEQVGRGQNNSSDPVYVWGNTGFPSQLNENPSYIQQNSDFYVNAGAKPGFTEYTYPHPLSGGEPVGGGDLKVPNPPDALQIN